MFQRHCSLKCSPLPHASFLTVSYHFLGSTLHMHSIIVCRADRMSEVPEVARVHIKSYFVTLQSAVDCDRFITYVEPLHLIINSLA